MRGQMSTAAALALEGSSSDNRTDGLLDLRAGLDSVTESISTPDSTRTLVGHHVASHIMVNKLSWLRASNRSILNSPLCKLPTFPCNWQACQ
jgi:hypothetical protein